MQDSTWELFRKSHSLLLWLPRREGLTWSLQVLSIAAEVQLGDRLGHMRDSHLHVLLGEVIAPGQVQLIQSAHQRRKKESMKPGHRNGLLVARTQSCKENTKPQTPYHFMCRNSASWSSSLCSVETALSPPDTPPCPGLPPEGRQGIWAQVLVSDAPFWKWREHSLLLLVTQPSLKD